VDKVHLASGGKFGWSQFRHGAVGGNHEAVVSIDPGWR
jgi:hypothetical protein